MNECPHSEVSSSRARAEQLVKNTNDISQTGQFSKGVMWVDTDNGALGGQGGQITQKSDPPKTPKFLVDPVPRLHTDLQKYNSHLVPGK